MLIVAGHIVSILVFVAVIVTAIYMAATLKFSTLLPCYQWIPRLVIVLLLLQSSVFLLMQADYLLGPHGSFYAADPEGPIRTLYAILNGITLVMFSTGLNVFFRWKRKPSRCLTRCPLVKKHDRIV